MNEKDIIEAVKNMRQEIRSGVNPEDAIEEASELYCIKKTVLANRYAVAYKQEYTEAPTSILPFKMPNIRDSDICEARRFALQKYNETSDYDHAYDDLHGKLFEYLGDEYICIGVYNNSNGLQIEAVLVGLLWTYIWDGPDVEKKINKIRKNNKLC